MRKFGLVGYPLTHSWSKKYFQEKFINENINDASYELYPINSVENIFRLIFNDKSIVGLNVTIPYKEKIIPFLNEFSDEAKKTKAANTLKIEHYEDEVSIKAYNTDVFGFEESIKDVLDSGLKNVLVLGTGGASKAVVHVLNKYGTDYTLVSRLKKNSKTIIYHELNPAVISKFDMIVNTTPGGMYPNSGEKPQIPYHALGSDQILYDLVYNPEKSLFLKEGEKKGCKTFNGLKMLHLQAEKSWEIWNK
ncbi:MAG: shikimate dehydrogenase [Bacteroidales bacterium]